MVDENKDAEPLLDKPKKSVLWINDSDGLPSVSITFLMISFWITTIAYIVSIIHKIGPVEFGSFDSGACAAYFGIIFTAYVGRKYTKARYGYGYDPNEDSTNRDYYPPRGI